MGQKRACEPLPARQSSSSPSRARAQQLLLSLLLFCAFASYLWPRDSCREAMQKQRRVSWDETSLILDGKRIFLWSGDFHPWRLPAQHLWRDVLQKIKAAGFNAVSVYTHWGMINPAEGVFDWEGPRAIRPFLEMAAEERLYVVYRPGPYIQTESTAGGLPGWVTALDTPLRTNSTRWREAWTPYIDSVIEQIKPYEYSRGGPIIAIQLENEHEQRPDTEEYLMQLRARFRDAGITSPLTINDADPSEEIAAGTYKGHFAQGRGAQDIFGFDVYPLGPECNMIDTRKRFPEGLHDLHMRISPHTPLYVPEMQAGGFDGWGSPTGYAKCNALLGPEYSQVFNLALWAENAKMINLYTLYGGTNWGHLAFPGAYTSYDFGAAISETRLLTPKYYELKSQGLFLQSVPDFASTRYIGELNTSNEAVKVTHLRGADGSSFYVMVQRDTASTSHQSVSLEIETSMGRVRIPPVGELNLHGRQAAVLVSDVAIGRSKMLYSTAPMLYAGSIGKRDVAVFTNALSSRFEMRMVDRDSGALVYDEPLGNGIAFTLSSVFSPDVVVLFLDVQTAKKVWAPFIEGGEAAEDNVLVIGPYLVRKAILRSPSHIELFGDVDGDTHVQVLAPEHVTRVSWNGEAAALGVSSLFPGGVAFSVPGPPTALRLPQLFRWRYHDGLPESAYDYNDSHWMKADKTQTAAPFKMLSGDKVLFACDYGFCTGPVLYRGRIRPSSGQTNIELAVSGGAGMSWQYWLSSSTEQISGRSSGKFMRGRGHDNVTINMLQSFRKEEELILTVLIDNMGQEIEDDRDHDRMRTPRGIIAYDGPFTSWRIQGFRGGNKDFPDRLRGVFNEGGTYGERAGWHLPGFDDSNWTSAGPFDRVQQGSIGVYRTTFDLDLPDELDMPIQLTFTQESRSRRYQIYVNGWNMGKRITRLGPQTAFYVPDGILNYRGTNTLALIVWESEDWVGGLVEEPGSLSLEFAGILRGGIGRGSWSNPGWADRKRI